MVYYINPVRAGLENVASLGDGQTIAIRWHKAYPSNKDNVVGYNVYYSTTKSQTFEEGVRYVALDGQLEANIINLTPGQMYFFSVRAFEYNPLESNILDYLIPAYDALYVIPETILREDILADSLIIPVMSIEGFPSTNGIVKIGYELINYSYIDSINRNFVLNSIAGRGYQSTTISIHNIDGFDGYDVLENKIKPYFPDFKEADRIFMCQARFNYPNNAYTLIDGYAQVTKDVLSTDLSISDEANQNFPMYDYSGYHRTDPVQLLTGVCVGSYIGGEQGCIDEFGNLNITRGMSLQDQNNQRQEMLLNVTGRPAVLLKRQSTGIICSCYQPSSEYQDDRCPFCFGTKFVLGYEQFFNPRRSDGRILVRPGPTNENLKMYEPGLESELPLELWTLTVPTIKTRDIIILFDQGNNEEFRYEVTTVGRNNTIVNMEGGQKFQVQRIRKTDPAYQIKVFRDTSMFPTKLNTTVGFVEGIPPHVHEIVRNEKDSSTWAQTTKISQGHNHVVVFKNGSLKVLDGLGHSHNIII